MTKLGKLAFLLPALCCLAVPAVAQSTPNDVHVKLTLADNRTTFRIGETIKLILEFTADHDGYQADVMTEGAEPTSDALSMAPDSGVFHWLESLRGGQLGGRDVVSFKALSSSPVQVELLINDSLRIDRPGRYTARVTTRRVAKNRGLREESSLPFVLTTNDVSFEVQAMSDDDETREVKRLSDQLDAARDWRGQEEPAKALSFLTGDISSREKVRRLLNDDGRSGNYSGHIYFGLFIARNRGLVLQLLEQAMRDPATPVDTQLLGAMTSLRFLQQNTGVTDKLPTITYTPDEPRVDPRISEIESAYISELAAGLSKRTGKSQTTTAMTILMHLPKDPQAAAAILSESRRILLQQFDSLTPFALENLLERYWDQLRDPALIPSLKKILSRTDRMSMAIHRSVLKRMIELSPEEARPYVIAEIGNPMVDVEVLGKMPDETIPEVDKILLSQLSALAKTGGIQTDFLIKQKAALAVRFATSNIYPELMTLYRENVSRLAIGSRAALLAYLVKQNEREALPLVEEALNGVPPNQEFSFLPELTKLYFSEGLAALVRKRLERDEPDVASNAAYLLSLYGSAGDQKVMQERLARWQREWSNRQMEADSNQQGRIESELVSGLIHGKNWKISPEQVKELQQGCITKYCKQQFRTP